MHFTQKLLFLSTLFLPLLVTDRFGNCKGIDGRIVGLKELEEFFGSFIVEVGVSVRFVAGDEVGVVEYEGGMLSLMSMSFPPLQSFPSSFLSSLCFFFIFAAIATIIVFEAVFFFLFISRRGAIFIRKLIIEGSQWGNGGVHSLGIVSVFMGFVLEHTIVVITYDALLLNSSMPPPSKTHILP